MAKITEDSFALDFHSMSMFQVTIIYCNGYYLYDCWGHCHIGILSGSIRV
jgi:hypothetical protein